MPSSCNCGTGPQAAPAPCHGHTTRPPRSTEPHSPRSPAGGRPPFYLNPLITFPVIFGLVGVLFYLTFAFDGIHKGTVSLSRRVCRATASTVAR